jgi:hypothetical protein
VVGLRGDRESIGRQPTRTSAHLVVAEPSPGLHDDRPERQVGHREPPASGRSQRLKRHRAVEFFHRSNLESRQLVGRKTHRRWRRWQDRRRGRWGGPRRSAWRRRSARRRR